MKTMKYLLFSITLFCICFLMYLFAVEIDTSCDNFFYKKYVVKRDCDFVLPDGYYLVAR